MKSKRMGHRFLVGSSVLRPSGSPPRLRRGLHAGAVCCKDGTVIVGRSMDWARIWHPTCGCCARMKRDGRGGKNTVSWESKYGSLIVSAYDIGTAEGMNEKGLVVNELALVESNYGTPAEAPR